MFIFVLLRRLNNMGIYPVKRRQSKMEDIGNICFDFEGRTEFIFNLYKHGEELKKVLPMLLLLYRKTKK